MNNLPRDIHVIETDITKDYRLDLLDEENRLKLFPTTHYDQFSFDELRLFCHFHGRYLLPTLELVNHLKELIGNKRALEIGAGGGDLGRFLGIDMIDNYQQQDNETIVNYYKFMQQPVIKYGKDVIKMDALEAVRFLKPQIVLGGWMTEFQSAADTQPYYLKSEHYGVKESEILEEIETYILIGAAAIHGRKKIMNKKHETFEFPFIKSRRRDNKIWIWQK